MASSVQPNYPTWQFYPSRSAPPLWARDIAGVFTAVKPAIDSRSNSGVNSDTALAALRPGLEQLGFEVESSKQKAGKIFRPVLFEEQGRPLVAYEVDGYHPDHRAVLEVEAGRGAANNADYRDLVRTSLMVDADFLILAMMLEYHSAGSVMLSYKRTRDRLDAIYASERIKLPFKGVLLIGY